jgi:hypothetical protein
MGGIEAALVGDTPGILRLDVLNPPAGLSTRSRAPHRGFALYDLAVLYMAEYNGFQERCRQASGTNVTVKKSVPALVVMRAIAHVARAAEASIDHRDR